MLTVVCWKWTNTGPRRRRIDYTAEHVNIFAAMVHRNLSMPHEVVCVTDEPEGIDSSIRIVPLWDDGLREKGGCYVRLKAFSGDIGKLFGPRYVSIDLDCVITGPLDPLFNRPDPFVIWRNVNHGSRHCGSMWMLKSGCAYEVWEQFRVSDLEMRTGRADHSHVNGRWVHPKALEAGNVIGSDQAWISTVLPNAPQWTRKDGVLSFKMDVGYARKPRFAARPVLGLPDKARIVFFHGAEDPSQPEVQSAAPWIKDFWRM